MIDLFVYICLTLLMSVMIYGAIIVLQKLKDPKSFSITISNNIKDPPYLNGIELESYSEDDLNIDFDFCTFDDIQESIDQFNKNFWEPECDETLKQFKELL